MILDFSYIGIYCFSGKDVVLRVRTKTGWLEIRIMCPSGVTCLPSNCCQHHKNPTQHVGLVQCGHHYPPPPPAPPPPHPSPLLLPYLSSTSPSSSASSSSPYSCHAMLRNCSLGVKQQSLTHPYIVCLYLYCRRGSIFFYQRRIVEIL